MIPNGKEMKWQGHHLVFESEADQCRGCFFADKDSCPDCDEGAWVEQKSYPWHTGKPTEEGYYLCHFTDGDRTFDACFLFTNGSWDISGYGLNPYTFEVVAWQKIEPYKEKNNETDFVD